MNNIEYSSSSYRGAKIRTYAYEGGRQFGVDVYYGDHEFHQDGYPTRTQALLHGKEYVDNIPGIDQAQTWNQDAMTKYAASAYGAL